MIVEEYCTLLSSGVPRYKPLQGRIVMVDTKGLTFQFLLLARSSQANPPYKDPHVSVSWASHLFHWVAMK
jgi:hypothetical protein